MYDKMVALQLEYERVDNEIAADSVLTLLDSVRSKAELTEDAIKSKWHDIFDNKVYAYNLMMERDSKLDIIAKAEQTLSTALISSEQRAEQCESGALVEYFYRKKALLNYEIQVADVYELSTAKDSLLRVSNTISESNFCLPKVTIVRRAFIDHEPIKVIKPTIYTPKNPIPHTKIYDYGTVYRVRIGIFTKRPNLTALKGIPPLSYTDKYHNGKYAYFVGGYRTEEEALEGVAYLKKLGFRDVIEAALGADMVAMAEAKELSEKGLLTSSCCPAFVQYIKSQFPNLVEHISHNMSPMAVLAKYIKETTPNAKVIFIGPCTAKKAEAQLEEVKQYVDTVLTFEELQALFDSRDIEIETLEEGVLDNASYFGRIFARSGGLTDAAAQAMKEQNIDFEIKPVVCDGIEACRMALLKLNKGILDGNFIEGMACIGGCIGGAGCLTHGEKNKSEVDKYGREALEKTIGDAISLLK